MKTYRTTYKFEKKGISYEAKVAGNIFNKENVEVNFYKLSDLKKSFAAKIINAVTWAISDKQNGLFVNDKPVMMLEAQLMQNTNDAYAVFIDGDLFPISMNVDIHVSNPFELLK